MPVVEIRMRDLNQAVVGTVGKRGIVVQRVGDLRQLIRRGVVGKIPDGCF